jgi:hypothetical protein
VERHPSSVRVVDDTDGAAQRCFLEGRLGPLYESPTIRLESIHAQDGGGYQQSGIRALDEGRHSAGSRETAQLRGATRSAPGP